MITPVLFKYPKDIKYLPVSDPFAKEIIAKKSFGKYTPFCKRDLYRRKAQEQKDYISHRTAAVYEGDELVIENGVVVSHKSIASFACSIGITSTLA